MRKRTNIEIEKDFKKIRKEAINSEITSLNKLANAVGLSVSAVKTSLSKHPRIKEEVFTNIKKNKTKKRTEELKAQKKVEQKAELITNHEFSNYNVVIDASITGTVSIIERIYEICKTNSKIILTSTTIRELEKIQKFNSPNGHDARRILSMAVENHNNFQTVLIDETLETADDCIIKYCQENKNNVVLLTADKTMALKARMYDIKTEYIKHMTDNLPKYHTKKTDNTLLEAKNINNKLFLSVFKSNRKYIKVISNGIEYSNEKEYELKIGDNVLLATRKNGYITFADYLITSLEPINNCKLVCAQRIYNLEDIKFLPKATYKSFLRDFRIQ